MWSLTVTVWVLQFGDVEIQQTETLAGYRYKADCVADIQYAVDGRMARPNVVSASARCVRTE